MFNLVVILLGTAALGDVASAIGVSQLWIGAAVAIVGAVQLVFDSGGRASEHKVLQRAYWEVLAEIEENADPDAVQVMRWRGKLARIAGDEPPTLRARDAKAYNDALDGLGTFDREERLVIPWWHSLFGGFFTFEGHEYKKVGEARK